MGTTASIIAAIDKELARLHKFRNKLIKEQAKVAESARSQSAKKSAKRRLSPAGRARIAEAQRKRWAKKAKKKE
jgi:hypothetical protein